MAVSCLETWFPALFVLGLLSLATTSAEATRVLKLPVECLSNPGSLKDLYLQAQAWQVGDHSYDWQSFRNLDPSPELALTLRNIANFQYILKATVGTPPQPISLFLDTELSEIWFTSSACTSIGCWGHQFYNANASSTSSQHRNIEYRSDHPWGVAAGYVALDNVTIGSTGTALTLVNQSFGLAEKDPGEVFRYARFDGILGLGPATTSSSGMTAPLRRMVQLDLLEEAVFSVFLSDLKSKRQSRLVLGAVDSSHFSGPLMWFQTLSPDRWDVADTSVQFGDQAGVLKNLTAILNPGQPGIELDPDVAIFFDAVIQKLGRGRPCDHRQYLPSFLISISKAEFVLGPDDYLVEWEGLCIANFFAHSHPLPLGTIVLGAPFLRKYFSVYDVESKQIGLALAS